MLPSSPARLSSSESKTSEPSDFVSCQAADFDLFVDTLVSQSLLSPQKTRLPMRRARQQKFRRDVLEDWRGKCVITGCDITEIVDAAHILPYSRGGELCTERWNGLALRTDVHRLFDLDLLRIAPVPGDEKKSDSGPGFREFRVCLKPDRDINWGGYASLNGRTFTVAHGRTSKLLVARWNLLTSGDSSVV